MLLLSRTSNRTNGVRPISKLIILRGNSASGKSTIAKALQTYYGDGTLLVSQDTVRRDMLKVRDREGNLSHDLIRQITEYGKGKCDVVILEGILNNNRYGEMLTDLIKFYDGKAYVYYFDLTFEETFKRHNMRSKKNEFGKEALKSWWSESDYLGIDGEVMVTDEMSEENILKLVVEQVQV
ncbi:kinase [Guptibacillus algicola]|uniref:kinase n=1 Tax=Guptibacillus algicola TaxID=225844 RepID=UPI001CD412F4|nr:kinase [Alkalihalobacillus algicola]MCA0987184.1 kinase [Alkalihalobacillus algicola]